MNLSPEFIKAFNEAQHHAKICRKCYMPIMDEEGNPGYYSEACTKGFELLKEYEKQESLILTTEE